MVEIPFLPAHEIANRVKSGDLTALEVTETILAHIEKVDGPSPSLDQLTFFGQQPSVAAQDRPDSSTPDTGVHAFITVTAERARAQARAIDAQLAAGEDPGPLAGVPFTVKDIFCVEGTPSTAGSRILANFISPYTATPVARMEAVGAVMLGKVNLDEFTYGSSTESSAFQPTTRNPWDITRAPGGSSGGSAAAVAAGEGPLSLGTDTAGSIRQPASFCGVVGLKPTYGRVSRYGLIAFGSSLDCPGPLTRNVTDAALMLNVIAGPDSRDATAANVPVPDYTEGIDDGVKGLRIGLSSDYFRVTFFDAQTGELHERALPGEIRDATLRAAELLARAGAEIVEDIPMPHTQYGIPVYFVISRVEAASNLHRFDGVKYGYRTPDRVADLREMYRKTRAQGFGPQPKLRILMGMYVSAAQYSEQYYNHALRVRSLIRRDFNEAFDPHGKHRLDALLTPSTPSTAFPIGDVYGDSVLMQYSDQLNVPANHAGTPGISLPAGLATSTGSVRGLSGGAKTSPVEGPVLSTVEGLDANRLPIGIQLLGPDFSEATLLRIGRAYEMVTEGEGWRKERPGALLDNQ